MSSIIVVMSLLYTFALPAPKQEKKKETISYRVFPYVYAKVWNNIVQIVIKDMGYLPEVADPQEGFMSTQWKIMKGGGSKRDRRMRIHINVKRTQDGTLVTIRCEIEEFVPVGNTGKGKWVSLSSDNTCEAELLDKLEEKLRK